MVGGLVDVLAVFGLNRFVTGEDLPREENNRMAREILSRDVGSSEKRGLFVRACEAMELAVAAGRLIDPQLREQLHELFAAAVLGGDYVP